MDDPTPAFDPPPEDLRTVAQIMADRIFAWSERHWDLVEPCLQDLQRAADNTRQRAELGRRMRRFDA